VKIGFKGTLATPLTIDEAAIRVLGNAKPLGVYPFGPQKNRTLAAISGGAADEVLQAIDEGVDLYVTGEMKHELYHQVEEAGINMLALGHYATEVFGPKAVMEKTARELNLEVEFIEVPTGL
jgi:putative NIF3 family GTP cyclohydrolase 1 type 2